MEPSGAVEEKYYVFNQITTLLRRQRIERLQLCLLPCNLISEIAPTWNFLLLKPWAACTCIPTNGRPPKYCTGRSGSARRCWSCLLLITTKHSPLCTTANLQRWNTEMWPVRSWGHLHRDRKHSKSSLVRSVSWCSDFGPSRQNNFILVSMREIEWGVHLEAEECFTAVNHDCVKQIIR